MRYLRFIFFVLITSYGQLYARQESKIKVKADTSKIAEIRMDPRSAFQESVAPEDFFKKVDFIPLKKSNKFSMERVDQLEVTNENYIVLNKRNSIKNGKINSIIAIFSKSGDFQALISGFYANFFAVDTINKNIIVRDFSKVNKMLIFDFKGTLKKSVDMPFSAETFNFLPNGEMALYQNYSYHKEKGDMLSDRSDYQNFNLILTKNFKSLSRGYLKFKPNLSDSNSFIYASPKNFYSSESFFFLQGYSNTVYELTNDNLVGTFKILLPLVNTLQDGFFNLQKAEQVKMLGLNKNAVYAFTDFYKIKDIVTFRLMYAGIPHQTFFYNLHSAALVALSQVKTDASPIGLTFGSEIMAADQEYFFSSVSAKTLFGNKKAIINSNNSSALLKQYLANKDESQNPVIVRMKILKF